MPGHIVERYTIVRLIQTSEKTKIFLASEELEEYVLKQVLDPAAFAHEVKCLKGATSKDLSCTHVVKYLRSFEEEVGRFIVMESGCQTAVEWRESCGLPVAAMLLKVGPDLLNAMEFLHTKVRLIHCDVKLSNLVWFAGPKKFKLVDFGAAQKAGDKLTEYTVANLPPEAAQCVLDNRPVCACIALDIWATGMALLSICNPQWLEQILPKALDIGDPASNTTILQRIADPSMVHALDLSGVPHNLQTILFSELLCVSPAQRADATKARAHNFWHGSATVGTQEAHKKMTGNKFVRRPWHFGPAAKTQNFDAVPGFSHQVRTIYKKAGFDGQEQRDEAFGSELDQLLEAFDSTSGGAVEIVEVDAIMNPQRESALEAQLWCSGRSEWPRVGILLQDGMKQEPKARRRSSLYSMSFHDGDTTRTAYSHLQVWQTVQLRRAFAAMALPF
jgi:hypothetical protein